MRKIIDLSPADRSYSDKRNLEDGNNGERPKESKFRIFLKWVVAVILIVALWQVFTYFNRNFLSNFPEVNKDRYQVVFLQNNVIYFGKLSNLNKSYVVMKGAYYFKSQDDKNGLNLIKLTNEIHRPEDELYIAKSDILFWENLSPDSPVVKIITQQEKK